MFKTYCLGDHFTVNLFFLLHVSLADWGALFSTCLTFCLSWQADLFSATTPHSQISAICVIPKMLNKGINVKKKKKGIVINQNNHLNG